MGPGDQGDLIEERLPARAASAPRSGLGERARFLIAISPVIGIFLLSEWLSITGRGSFAGLLGFTGVIALPQLGGVFPILLVSAARRKGDFVPAVVFRLLGNPAVLVASYLFFLSAIFVHGLVIWESTAERIVTLLAGVGILTATIVILRRGALFPRAVVELREDHSPGGQDLFNIPAGGQSVPARVRLNYADGEQEVEAATGEVKAFDALRSPAFRLPATGARELKVWAHRLTAEGISEGLAVRLELQDGAQTRQVDLSRSNGQVVLPLAEERCEARLTFSDRSPRER